MIGFGGPTFPGMFAAPARHAPDFFPAIFPDTSRTFSVPAFRFSCVTKRAPILECRIAFAFCSQRQSSVWELIGLQLGLIGRKSFHCLQNRHNNECWSNRCVGHRDAIRPHIGEGRVGFSQPREVGIDLDDKLDIDHKTKGGLPSSGGSERT